MPFNAAFNEHLYLDKNPDVREVVDSGKMPSGFYHYVTTGFREDRQGMPEDPTLVIEGALGHAAPPAFMRVRVHGDDLLGNYFINGQAITSDLLKALPHGLTDKSRILDFGCGCGRVVSFLRKQSPGQIFGTDIDPETVGWCASNLGGAGTFELNNDWPPLRYPDSFFDLIYSVSIFTHLPEKMQLAWLEELSRVLAPGGVALLTVHGEDVCPKDERVYLKSSGFSYFTGTHTDGLPEFYRTAYHSIRYIRRKWNRFFEVERIISRGLNNHQDIVVCRRRTRSFLGRAWSNAWPRSLRA